MKYSDLTWIGAFIIMCSGSIGFLLLVLNQIGLI